MEKNIAGIPFDPLIQKWFSEKYPQATDIQIQAWQYASRGDHLLITAPTGSGKTLAAFLWALNQLISGAWIGDVIRVLYISPLKALNSDIRINLLEPLSELKEYGKKGGRKIPDIRIQTRSGDTPQSERQKMLRKPPHIFITTPESLNIMLTSKNASKLFSGLAMVILDEIHAVAGSKRGTHLITAVERLVPLCGEFQRIGLSATVKPLSRVAAFMGGGNPEKRKVRILSSDLKKRYDLRVVFPEDARDTMDDDSWWPGIINQFTEIIENNRSTLFFTNSRRLTEKVTRMINEKAGFQAAYSHHGSLSRETRTFVEEKLKHGELRAIVATSSLELGIDIGKLDEIILIQAPYSISSAVQRIGRSGHRVSEKSRGRIYPLHGKDFIVSAVTARLALNNEIEEIHIPECPLDVLAQIILSAAARGPVDTEDVFMLCRNSYPYRNLTKGQFSLVLEMLAGKYADSRIRELSPRISYDKLDRTITAKPGAVMALYMSGGTIPDRGYFDLRVSGSGSKIGELDEEFVWERSVGDTFIFGTQAWHIRKIDHQSVEVVPVQGVKAMTPFWKAEPMGRDFFFAERIGLFLEEINDRLDDLDLPGFLQKKYFMDETASEELINYCKYQKEHTESDLPSRHLLVIEHFSDPFNRTDSKQVILHTFWGGKVNAPFAFMLSQVWMEKYGFPLEIYHDDDCIMLNLPHDFRGEEIFSLVKTEKPETLLRAKLESTGFFGARFRENSARALLLPKASFNRRMPLWLTRLRAKKLLQAVSGYDDFPILAETWRTCFSDEFDLHSLKRLLDEIDSGEIRIQETVTSRPSPFASNLIWRQTNHLMYQDDTPHNQIPSSLREDLIREIAFSSELRPKIPVKIITEFTEKLHRTYPGYAPETSRDLLDWVKERVCIPKSEWAELLAAVDRMTDGHALDAADEIREKILEFSFSPESPVCITAKENTARLKKENYSETVAQWLRYYGPIAPEYLQGVFGLSVPETEKIISELREENTVVLDRISEGAEETEICDSENLEILLRIKRRRERPEFKPLPLAKLGLFLARHQGLTPRGDSIDSLKSGLERLMGFPLSAGLWEREIIPARLKTYYTSWMDSLFGESDILWYGAGKEKVSFCFGYEGDLFFPGSKHNTRTLELFPDSRGRYGFWDLKDGSGLASDELAEILWSLVWKGEISNDSFAALRRGILNRFKSEGIGSVPGTGRLSKGYSRWKSSRPITGNWFLLPPVTEEGDLLVQEEKRKDRVRQLLLRYGIIFRELLDREHKKFRWGELFRTLRIMELSGEVLSGYFFEGIPGPQFISHEAYRELNTPLPEDEVFWLNARDPASLCGIGIDIIKEELPRRLPSNHIVYHGENPVLFSKRSGKEIIIKVPPPSPDVHRYLTIFRELCGRDFDPLSLIRVEKINGADAGESEFAGIFIDNGFIRENHSLVLRGNW